jgi:tungstate transport system ATP-binding protein
MLYDLNNVTKVYGTRTILDIPELSLQAERIYSLIGPNGAGKTTLLQILAFLDPPSSGAIRFRSKTIKHIEKDLLPLRRQIVLVDQMPIFFTGPVWQNLEFGLKVRKIERKQRKLRIAEALERVGMQNFLYADAHKLSGGETKRVALARALVLEPKVMLCDEPTAGVDTENISIIQNILARANKDLGVSIIFTTHSASEAEQLAHHTLVLKNGHFSALPRSNVFSATFIEQIADRSIYLLSNSLRIAVKATKSRKEVVQLTLNPEHLYLVSSLTDAQVSENHLPGKIAALTAEKEMIRVSIDIGVVVHLQLSREKYNQMPPQIGEEVHLVISDKAISIE